jgi:hypothetical protein
LFHLYGIFLSLLPFVLYVKSRKGRDHVDVWELQRRHTRMDLVLWAAHKKEDISCHPLFMYGGKCSMS